MFCGRGFVCGERYARVHLRVNDYYEKGKSVKGVWLGKACEEFGVAPGSEVQDDDFSMLSEGFSPGGRQLCDRIYKKAKRSSDGSEIVATGRRSFYDLTLNAPKSFSIMAVTVSDNRIREWHDHAVLKTFERIERMTARRVHLPDGAETLNRTAKAACARYSHNANRALDP